MAVVLTNKIGTLLGPLTTAWSMPDSCTVHVLNCPTCGEGYRGQQCGIGADGSGSPTDHTSCWPPVISRAGTPSAPFHGWGFYSPGLACPTGYTAACTAVHGGRSEWEVQFTLIAGETAIGCCPEYVTTKLPSTKSPIGVALTVSITGASRAQTTTATRAWRPRRS